MNDYTYKTYKTKREQSNAFRKAAVLIENSMVSEEADDVAKELRNIARAIDHGGKFGVK